MTPNGLFKAARPCTHPWFFASLGASIPCCAELIDKNTGNRFFYGEKLK